MTDRPTKMHNGIKVIGVIEKATDGCLIRVRGEVKHRCVHSNDMEQCPCPFGPEEQKGLRGFWLPEPEALALLLTGDVE